MRATNKLTHKNAFTVLIFMGGGSNSGPKYLMVFEKPVRRYMYRQNWDIVFKKVINSVPL